MKNKFKLTIHKAFAILIAILSINSLMVHESISFPIYAQQGYEDPREATGRIVCANCHLAQKQVDIEIPKSVLPNSIFEAKVSIPYNPEVKQLLGNGTEGNLNTGAVLILPEGFKLAPKNLLSEELKNKTKNFYIQNYSTSKSNILVVGPIGGKNNQDITFPILSPDPSKDKNTFFLKYPIYVGGNRGRGQIYPTGEKSNNNLITSSVSGILTKVNENSKGGFLLEIEKTDGDIVVEEIPKGLSLVVKEGNKISVGQNLTNDPNAGGFGQNETEIVLQNPERIKSMIIFFVSVTLAQIFFVLKKKQWERVQAAEMNY
uniref:Cytochrome f n=1 Tax=Tolypiocladia glomerulata TaxID=860646 RepID=A0A1Z1MUJ3_9FLOR|nr:Apocytochrome f [Tolypiocladia glomerulata]ARW69753.1 Apocytochrome f [Tolypiocladia glomerulata]